MKRAAASYIAQWMMLYVLPSVESGTRQLWLISKSYILSTHLSCVQARAVAVCCSSRKWQFVGGGVEQHAAAANLLSVALLCKRKLNCGCTEGVLICLLCVIFASHLLRIRTQT